MIFREVAMPLADTYHAAFAMPPPLMIFRLPLIIDIVFLYFIFIIRRYFSLAFRLLRFRYTFHYCRCRHYAAAAIIAFRHFVAFSMPAYARIAASADEAREMPAASAIR
jgi:hypothetical protein